jgi:hypothetical protein
MERLPSYKGPDTIEEAFAATLTARNVKDEKTRAAFVFSDVEEFLSRLENGGALTPLPFIVNEMNIRRPNFFFLFAEDGHLGSESQGRRTEIGEKSGFFLEAKFCTSFGQRVTITSLLKSVMYTNTCKQGNGNVAGRQIEG